MFYNNSTLKRTVRIAPRLIEKNLFGLNSQDWPVRGVTSGGNGSSPPVFPFGMFSTYGCNDLHWGRLNPADGVYNWTALDTFVSAAESRGSEVLYVIAGCPTWLAQTADVARNDPWGLAGGGSVPTNLTKLQAFCTSLIGRYNSGGVRRIKYVQLFNEPQFGTLTGYFWGTAPQYVDMLSAAYTALVAADPQLVVISAPAIVRSEEIAWWNAIGTVSGSKGVNCFNAVGTHPYFASPIGTSGRGGFDGLGVGGLNVLQAQLVAAGRSERLDVYATEYGLSSNSSDGVVTEFFTRTAADRSSYVQRVFAAAAVHGLKTLCLFSYGNTYGNCIGDLVSDAEGVLNGISVAYTNMAGRTLVGWSAGLNGTITIHFGDGPPWEI